MWSKTLFFILASAAAAVAQTATTPTKPPVVNPPVINTSAPVLFERAEIIFRPNNISSNPGEAIILRPDVKYDVEVRNTDALKLEYIHTLNTLTENTGVMIVFKEPVIGSLPHMAVLTPVDAVFIAADGTVVQLVSGVVLANLLSKIGTPSEVKALLFLKNGQIGGHYIKPQDRVLGPMFKTGMVIQQ